MIQQGQVFQLKRCGRDGQPQWAYRYRAGGRGSRRVQRGGFATEQDAIDALNRELDRVRREQRIPRGLTFSELVDVYLAQHDVQPVTIEKLRWLLSKATAVFGERRIGELTAQEIAEWRMNLSRGYRFEATQAVRQVLNRAVVWGMLDRPRSESTTQHRDGKSSTRSSPGQSWKQSPPRLGRGTGR